MSRGAKPLQHALFGYMMLFAAASCSSDGGGSDGTPPPAGTVTVEVCPSYLDECDGRCTDTQSDPAHCGACETACTEGEVCLDGTCTAAEASCPESQVQCDDKCIDPKTDPVFCGASGDCQDDNAGKTCAAGEKCNGQGECQLSCQDGLLDCDGTCVDPMNNDAHCGATADCKGANAGTECVKPEQCIGYGFCGPVCSASELACSEGCVDPMTDMNHCGATTDCTGANAGAKCSAVEECAQGTCKKLAIACTMVTNAGGCTQGAIDQIKLAKNLTAQQCHDQCEKEMPLKSMTKGCWVIASDTYCYCRSGLLSLGGKQPGGSCIKP